MHFAEDVDGPLPVEGFLIKHQAKQVSWAGDARRCTVYTRRGSFEDTGLHRGARGGRFMYYMQRRPRLSAVHATVCRSAPQAARFAIVLLRTSPSAHEFGSEGATAKEMLAGPGCSGSNKP